MDAHAVTPLYCQECPLKGSGSPCHGPCHWAGSGNPAKVRAVVNRAKMPAPDRPPPREPADPVAAPPKAPTLARRVGGCPARERCGCQRPKCHDPVFGPRYGVKETQTLMGAPPRVVYRVTLDDCKRCVLASDRALPPPPGKSENSYDTPLTPGRSEDIFQV